MSEEKAKKPFYKQRRFIVLAFIFICWIFNSLTKDWNSTTSTSTSSTYVSEKTTKMRNVVQKRIETASALFKDEQSEFVSMQCKDQCKDADINIYYSQTPYIEWIKDTVDFIARWQSVNLSNELADENLSSQARVYIYVGDENIYRCSAYERKIWACKDLRK